METKIMNVRQVCEALGVTRPTLLKLRRSRAIPEPAIIMSARKVYWRVADIQDWLNSGRKP